VSFKFGVTQEEDEKTLATRSGGGGRSDGLDMVGLQDVGLMDPLSARCGGYG
jgi:hypothetical protein